MGEAVLDWLFDNVMPWLASALIIFFVLFLLGLPFLIWADSKAERFSLKKDRWECSKSIQVPTTTYVQTGNVMVPITTYSTQCTQWTEKP